MKYLKYFESLSKFDFKINKVYQYYELPQEIKDDIDLQFEDNYEESGQDYQYRCQLIKHKDLGEWIENHFGREYEEYLEDEDMIRLINDIKINGLKYPSVGSEGNHRALAHWKLGLDLPYLKMEYKNY